MREATQLFGPGQKPGGNRWDINYACSLVRQPLFIIALSEDSVPVAKGLAFNGPLTKVLGTASTPPIRLSGNAVGSNIIRHSPFWGFHGLTAADDFRVPALAADAIPAQGLTYAFVRQPVNTTITRTHSFGHAASAGTTRRAGGHAPLGDGVVYWDYGGATAPNRLTWSGYTPAVNMETWCFVGGANGLAIYFNGIQRATSATGVTRTQGADTIGINTGNVGTAGENINFFLFAAFGAEWTAAEVSQWHRDPYAIIRALAPERGAPKARTSVTVGLSTEQDIALDLETERSINVGLATEEDQALSVSSLQTDGWPFDEFCPRHLGIYPCASPIGGGVAMTGKEPTIDSGNGYWRIVLGGFYIKNREQILLWRALEARFQGRAGTILLPFFDGKRAPWLVVGGAISATANAAVAVGATSMVINATSSGPLLVGQHFSAGQRGYRIIAITSQAGNLYGVNIWPKVRDPIGAGDTIEFVRPVVRMRLESDNGMNLPLHLLKRGDATVDFVEDI